MTNIIFVYGIGMVILSIIYNIDLSPKKDEVDERKEQTRKLFRENIEKSKINEIIKSSAKFSRRVKIEYDIKRAGYDFSFQEFILISLGTAALSAVLFGALMKNILLGILFIFIGFILPFQYIGFLKNKRVSKLEKQIGSFMQMTIKRYINTKNMHTALKMTAKELKGIEPISSEIERTIASIELGTPITEALYELAKRTDNKYMERFASYYEIAAKTGTRALREELLGDAYNQFEENRQLKRTLAEKISGPVKHAKILMGAVPAFAVYSAFTNDNYVDFMLNTTMGKAGTTGIIATLLGVLWFVNKKIGAPLD